MDWNLLTLLDFAVHCKSLSSRRAWIEIAYLNPFVQVYQASLSSRRAWIEITFFNPREFGRLSLSSRRAWIEIVYLYCNYIISQVALLTESVDWNHLCLLTYLHNSFCRSPHGERGLKSYIQQSVYNAPLSLSSRRAWIEMPSVAFFEQQKAVALLTESVDWNISPRSGVAVTPKVALLTESVDWNLWDYWLMFAIILVALLTESVDWNLLLFSINLLPTSRSPHGERGLK